MHESKQKQIQIKIKKIIDQIKLKKEDKKNDKNNKK